MFRVSVRPDVSNSEPIRAELFSLERLEEHARSLAEAQVSIDRRGRFGPLLSRLRENGDVLLIAYRELARAIREETLVTPAAEWLVDNFHLVEAQLHDVRESLPVDYYQELPKISSGHLAGYPGVYGIAWAYVSHLDSRFDSEALSRFINAYQEVQPLTMGELWAVPITLRLVLVENLRRLADLIVKGRALRREADRVADALFEAKDSAEAAERSLRHGSEELPGAFAVQLLQRLRANDPDTTVPLDKLLSRLEARGITPDELINEVHQRQAATNVSVRNVITSFRHISTFDWSSFVEDVSLVDRLLTEDGPYAEMSFDTHDLYRHAIEAMARASPSAEIEITRAAISLASDHGVGQPERDPGYYLIGPGRDQLEALVRYQVPWVAKLRRALGRHAALVYVGSITAAVALVLAIPVALSAASAGYWAILIGVLALIPASELAVAVVNRVVFALVKPDALPSLELPRGPTEAERTVVAIPALLSSSAQLLRLVERLEIHYLAHPEGEFRFALLTDWPDADEPRTDADAGVLQMAIEAISHLNERHGPCSDGSERFLLFHRNRLFNPGEGLHMGWERKRGKLTEFNRLLRGSEDTSYLSTGSKPPTGVRFVVTLDADSRLPPGAATRLVATIAHPLNRAIFDSAAGRVVAGYGILQPRVTAFLSSAGTSVFQRVFSAPAGIDPYAAAVSDVFQDLFGEGSFAGKGIYDIDAFEAALAGRIPENTLLSHDLFEGTFARAGLASTVEVFEEFPSDYEVAASRQHRWIRGDWQLLPWILGLRGRLPGIGRLKMVENLRRSLVAPGAVLTLLAAFVLPGVPVWPWIGLVIATLAFPALLPLLERMIPRRTTTPGAVRFSRFSGDLLRIGERLVLQTAFLAHQAQMAASAIFVTLWRLVVSRRGLLTWLSAEEAERRSDLSLSGFIHRMGTASVVGLIAAAGAALLRPETWPVALAWAGLWVLSPLIAYGASLPRAPILLPTLDQAEIQSVRIIGRRTWRFFETFVTAEENWLPPDNFQEDPSDLAHRTSPTNIGLYLLSVLVAREFGWIGRVEMVERLENTLATINRLDLHEGHLFNWYDTTTSQPLVPRYVSSVDSGNLAGHLLTVAQGCLRESGRKSGSEVAAGIRDTILLFKEAAGGRLGAHSMIEVVSAADLDRAVEEMEELVDALARGERNETAVLRSMRDVALTVQDIAQTAAAGGLGDELSQLADTLMRTVGSHLRDAESRPTSDLEDRLSRVATTAASLATNMDFTFLLDPANKLLAVGHSVSESGLDGSHYDLLASEARLASFIGIAKGDLPPAHWFHLGRPMTPLGAEAALISWSGSMFEYLMPYLVMRTPPGSLLDATYRAVVRRQIEYGRSRSIPWGISESAFAARDTRLVYQYSAFGVPGLGFERGLSEDLVVAPYATVLAAMVEPKAAFDNLEELAGLGALSRFGFYESIDFTTTRVPDDGQPVLIKAFMAHHQGMTLVALANVVFAGLIRDLFHSEPLVMASELLLHEQIPRDVEVARPRAEEVAASTRLQQRSETVVRRFSSPHTRVPVTHLLSNGRYTVMITGAGSGYSQLGRQSVTRWREDATSDGFGSYIYIKDENSGRSWSAGYQPRRVEPSQYAVTLSEDHAEISRRDGVVETTLEIVVSAEDDAEVRRLTLTNLGAVELELEVTSYAEIVLAPPKADASHPAFSNLFVQTEAVPGHEALLATRRPRTGTEEPLWAGHVVSVIGEVTGGFQYETDRSRFLGRGRNVHQPAALDRPLSNTTGPVLDPIFSLRKKVRIRPGGTAHVIFATVVANDRVAATDLVDKFSDSAVFDRSKTLAWTQAQVRLHHLGIEPDQAHIFQELAGALIYADPTRRAPPPVLARTPGRQEMLWRHGISGDLPIVLVRIDQPEDRGIVRDLLRAQEYWRMKGLYADLVVINQKPGSYSDDLQHAIEDLVRGSGRRGREEPDGGAFIFQNDQLSPEERLVLAAAARTILLSHHGTIADQLARTSVHPPLARPRPRLALVAQPGGPPPRLDLGFWNGLGGFSADGSEYVVVLGEAQSTPAPWINVIANPNFGSLVSESGSGYTWSENSRENQLTPWSNDPISDPPGEVVYIRDDDNGEVWTPTALPIRDPVGIYVIHHGPGYTRFEHTSRGIETELIHTVPLEDSIKLTRLYLRNRSSRKRSLSVTAYAEWVLGTSRSDSALRLVTELDPETGALLARNPWNPDFPERVAFLHMGGTVVGWTTDRTEFLGRHGSADQPAGLQRGFALMKSSGAGLDPCAVLQQRIVLAPGEQREITILLGQGRDLEDTRRLIESYRRTMDLAVTNRQVSDHWKDVLGAVTVKTPDRSFDLMINRWLLYQVLACRVHGRSAFYQAGGAFGFRDQIQDVMALTVPMRSMAREHLLKAASRQFEDGDVQHWWHEPSGKGVRTRISDDYLWLPYAVAHYQQVTGDATLLDEVVPFLYGPKLEPGQDEAYFTPEESRREATVFEHCRKALDRATARLGPQGLPLIGTGDWNDGFNRVGEQGTGESVWLGWFLEANLARFAELADSLGKSSVAARWRRSATKLRDAIEEHAWDGDWYRRAFFDDGTPIGSSASPECRIDSIAQSWSVMHGGGQPEKARRAMEAVEQYLVRRGDGLVLLFTPPFDNWNVDPGYIKGYVPGVRENGGQYTHAAIWAVIAFAILRDGDRAGELFSILNPINHGSTRAGIYRYKVEPYVAAADVYSEAPHAGRGGWTWYTGSAGWMYRAGVEWILGFRLRGERLWLDPCIPRGWRGFEMTFRYHSATYQIAVENPDGVCQGVKALTVDGIELDPTDDVGLVSDGATHSVRVLLG